MRLSDFIKVDEGFQTSVNLEYDLDNTKKIQSYIPTEQSVRVLGAFLKSYYFKSHRENRATVLIGPYGRGKSHLLLVLSALTSLDLRAANEAEKQVARQIQYELCEKVSLVDAEVGALAKTIVDDGIRTLPVIINSNTTDINQAFLIAINEALRNANLQYLVPNTYFDSAIAVIEKWKTSYPDAYGKLITELRKSKTTVDDLCFNLKQYSQKAYILFCECYPSIAAGTEFNPLTNMDIVKLYLAVTKALCEQTDYCGITIIFDEFSKFLEANLDKSKMLNFKIIQDMAEAATRSDTAQLHLTCITQKDILDYSSSDSFKTVEGRFYKQRFVTSSDQTYELISNAIIKNDLFEQFKIANQEHFTSISVSSGLSNVFNDLSEEVYQEKIVYGCYPLAPLSTFALLHVSELVGQNERTLFTFLAQKGDHTLLSFIEDKEDVFAAITIDYIYDYFEDLFKKEVFNSAVHSIWAKTDSALRQVSDETQKKILKGISVINIIGDERLKPTPSCIKAALMLKDDQFEAAITYLQKIHILSQRGSSEYVLLTANGVDVQKAVDAYVKTNLPRISECEVLEKACDLGYVLPRAYNDDFCMMRCFKNIYMNAQVFIQYENGEQILKEYPFDGVIIHIICLHDDLEKEIKEKIKSFVGLPQIILCFSSLSFGYDLLLKQYKATEMLLSKSEMSLDSHFIEELEVYQEDLQKRIQNTVFTMFAPSSEHSYFMHCDGEIVITKQTELNRKVSDICSSCYGLVPRINNEMVNKRVLNTQNTKARNLVVQWVLQHADDSYIPCMDGFGPEVSIFKSAFKHTGLDASSFVKDEGINAVLKEISHFIMDSENQKKSFDDLYQVLCSSPFGMRKGIIPLFIAYVLRQYEDNAVLYYNNKEIELSAGTLSLLNESPEKYQLLIEPGTSDREKYLDGLQLLFEKYGNNNGLSSNRIYSIVKNMQSWMRSLPEYTKKYKYYLENGVQKTTDSSIDAVRVELMRFEINSRELLFSTLVEKLNASGNLSACLAEIERVKMVLDNHLERCRKELIQKLITLFRPGYAGSLASAVISWYKEIPEQTKHHIFDADTNALLSLASSINAYDDEKLLDDIVNTFVSIAVEDWGDANADALIKSVTDAILKVNEYIELKRDDEEDGRLSIVINGTVVEKTFTAEAISPLGETAFNNLKSVFEEYNDALEPEEQLAILAKLIEEIIQ